jgi:phosphoribosylanthranilate isomerase
MLKTVTITGADNKVEWRRLDVISNEYPFVEWAFLYYPERHGERRYPSQPFIHFAADGMPGRVAMHLCGSAVRRFIDGEMERFLVEHKFSRLQLNFKMLDFSEREVHHAIRTSSIPVITQHNRYNNYLWRLMRDVPNHQVLFDASRGKGKTPAKWPTPFPDLYCGYAGGLSPDNLDAELPRIFAAAGDRDFWIDMESGVRTNNEFDLEKVKRALDTVQRYL